MFPLGARLGLRSLLLVEGTLAPVAVDHCLICRAVPAGGAGVPKSESGEKPMLEEGGRGANSVGSISSPSTGIGSQDGMMLGVRLLVVLWLRDLSPAGV